MTYVVQEHRTGTSWRFEIGEETTRETIDLFRSRESAESHCAALNAGAARINPHAVVGCRIEVAR